jgi:hypothetical protein
VPPHGAEAGELILDRQDVLKRTKRREDQAKPIRPEIEALHRALDQAEVLRRPPPAELLEHRLGGIEARARESVPRNRKKDPPGPAPKLEYRTARVSRQAPVEIHVSRRTPEEPESEITVTRIRAAIGVGNIHGAPILFAGIARSPVWLSYSLRVPDTSPSARELS